MKAWVLYGPGDLRAEERPVPKPKEGEALLKVAAAGVCGSDIPRIYETGAHVHPIIPGHEFAGTVTDCADASLAGARVGVFPLIPCLACAPCLRKEYELCRNYSYLGSRRDGGFAEYVTVPVRNLLKLPDDVPFERAACLEPLSVAVHAARRAAVTPEDSAVVIGLGTIGLFVTAYLLSLGVGDVTVVGNKEFQREKALELGASRYLDTRMASAAGDVVFECVGRSETAALAIECAAPGGRVVMAGNPAADMRFPRDAYWKLLRNQLTVRGTWNSSFTGEEADDWHEALRFLQSRGEAASRVITHRFPPEELERGLRIMRDKTEPYGKIMILR